MLVVNGWTLADTPWRDDPADPWHEGGGLEPFFAPVRSWGHAVHPVRPEAGLRADLAAAEDLGATEDLGAVRAIGRGAQLVREHGVDQGVVLDAVAVPVGWDGGLRSTARGGRDEPVPAGGRPLGVAHGRGQAVDSVVGRAHSQMPR